SSGVCAERGQDCRFRPRDPLRQPDDSSELAKIPGLPGEHIRAGDLGRERGTASEHFAGDHPCTSRDLTVDRCHSHYKEYSVSRPNLTHLSCRIDPVGDTEAWYRSLESRSGHLDFYGV